MGELTSRRVSLPEAQYRAAVRALTRMRTASACVFAVIGAGELFGPKSWRAGGSYRTLAFILPLRLWGVLFLAVALAQFIGFAHPDTVGRFGLATGAATAAAWAVSLAVYAFAGRALGICPAALWAFLAVSQVYLSGRPSARRRR